MKKLTIAVAKLIFMLICVLLLICSVGCGCKERKINMLLGDIEEIERLLDLTDEYNSLYGEICGKYYNARFSCFYNSDNVRNEIRDKGLYDEIRRKREQMELLLDSLVIESSFDPDRLHESIRRIDIMGTQMSASVTLLLVGKGLTQQSVKEESQKLQNEFRQAQEYLREILMEKKIEVVELLP